MRKFCFLFSLLTLLLFIGCSDQTNNAAKITSEPRIKRLVTQQFDYTGDSLSKIMFVDWKVEEIFNSNGKLARKKSTRILNDGPLTDFEFYNERGILVEEKRFDQNDSCFEQTIHQLDDKDRILKKEVFHRRILQWKTEYHYKTETTEDNLTKEIQYDTSENVCGVFWYDEKSHLVKKANRDDGSTRYVTEYNDSGQVTAMYMEGPGKGMLGYYVDVCNDYDKNGRIIIERSCEPDWKLTAYAKFDYAEDGSFTKTEIPSPLTKSNTRKYYYDAKGNILKDETYRDGVELSYTVIYNYEFDQYGNWISKTEIHGTEKKRLIKRTIEYF